MKKFISLLLVVAMCLSLISTTAFATNTEGVEEITNSTFASTTINHNNTDLSIAQLDDNAFVVKIPASLVTADDTKRYAFDITSDKTTELSATLYYVAQFNNPEVEMTLNYLEQDGSNTPQYANNIAFSSSKTGICHSNLSSANLKGHTKGVGTEQDNDFYIIFVLDDASKLTEDTTVTVTGMVETLENVETQPDENACIVFDDGDGEWCIATNRTEAFMFSHTFTAPKAPVAQIGEGDDAKTYPSLAAAVAAVPTNGTPTTITMIGDETIDVDSSGKGIVVPAGVKLTLELAGHKIVGYDKAKTGYQTLIEIKNGAEVVINDSSDPSTGLIQFNEDPGGNKGSPSSTIDNHGKLTLNAGTIENTSTDQTTALEAAVDVHANEWGTYYSGNTEFIMNGGTLKTNNNNTLRLYDSSQTGSGEVHIVATINDGTIIGKDTAFLMAQWTDKYVVGDNDPIVWMNPLELNINGGTFQSTNGIRVTGDAKEFNNQSYRAIKINIEDGVNLGTKAEGKYYVYDVAFQETGGWQSTKEATAKLRSYAEVNGKPAYNPYVAKVGEVKYQTLGDAISAVSSAQTKTITLLDDVENVGAVSLPANVTLDGDGKIISGDSAIYINAAGGTVKNVVFQDIGNTNQNLSAIYARDLTGKLVVDGCRFVKWDWDAIQSTPKANAEFEITNSYFEKQTNTNNRCCVHVEASKNANIKATITGNTFVTSGYVSPIAIWYASNNSTIALSNNYFDVLHLNVALYDENKLVTDKCDLAFPCKAAPDAETATVTPTYKRPYAYGVEYYCTLEEAIQAGNVALIGNVVYKTLTEAIAAVTDGTATTIKLLDNVSENVIIPAGRTITLDLNGKTIDGGTVSNKAAITNNGTLTITGAGTIKREDTGSSAYYVIKNNGTLTFAKNFTGTVSNNSGSATGEPWSGSALIDSGTAAGQTLAINGGTFTQENFIVIKNEEYGTLTITGGTFTSHGYFKDTNRIASAVQNWHEATITGGNFVGGIDTLSYGQTANTKITGGTFTNTTFWQQNYNSDSNIPTLEITGGNFALNTDKPWAFGGNKAETISENEAVQVSGGYYTKDVSAYVADGYVCVSNTEEATKTDYPNIVKAAEVEVGEEATTVNKNGDKADTIDSKVSDELAGQVKQDVVEDIVENAEETYASNIQQQITEEKVAVKDNESSGQIKEVTLGESTKTRIDVKLESLQVNVGTSEEEEPTMVTECTVTTQTATYDVKPVVTVTTTNDETGETTVETLVITNEWLKENNKVLTFTLPVPDSMTGNSVLVKHIKENGDEETFNARVEGEVGKRFITIVATEFSTYELSQQTEEDAVAKIENGGKTYYYSSLANAVSDAQNDDTIVLLKDSEAGTITVDRVVTFTINKGGYTNNATIAAGDGYTLSRSGNTYTVTQYVAPTHTGGGTTSYTVTVESARNGSVSADKKSASANSTVTITVSPDKGFTLETLTVTDKNGKEVEVKNLGNNKFSFKMPRSKVSVEATFAEAGICPQDETCVYAKFTDSNTKEWYHDGVHYCVENGMMNGVSDTQFAPSGTLTRGMVVTVLARLDGVTITSTGNEWYADGQKWAVANGISDGTNMTANITREQLATMLYRYAQFKGVDTNKFTENTNTLSHTDVFTISEWATSGMHFCIAAGVVGGDDNGMLNPHNNATRAEAATMFQRFCERIVK